MSAAWWLMVSALAVLAMLVICVVVREECKASSDKKKCMKYLEDMREYHKGRKS